MFHWSHTSSDMEQRKGQRFDLRRAVELVRHNSRPASGHGQTKNLSSTGVLFHSNANLEVGDLLEYLITFPAPETAGPVRIHCVGKVVRLPEASMAAVTVERHEFVRQFQESDDLGRRLAPRRISAEVLAADS